MTGTSLKILVLTATTVSLTACGATTNGLGNALAQKAVSQAVASRMAADEPVIAETTVRTTTVVTPVDETLLVSSEMSPQCREIATKMAATDARIESANVTINGGENIAGQAAASVATQAALHNGAASVISKVPFGGLFAKAAMDSAANSGKKKIAKAQKDLSKATLQRAKLEGMYAGKGC